MTDKTNEQILKEYDRILLWLSGLFSILLIFLYFFATEIFFRFGPNVVEFVQNLVTEFFPIGITFIISYSIFRKIQEIKDRQRFDDITDKLDNLNVKIEDLKIIVKPPTILKEIPWKTLIKQADEINFLVQGWDSWMKLHYSELEDFCRRDGTFNLYVLDPESQQATLTRDLMAKRLEKLDTDAVFEIKNTISTLKDIYNGATTQSSKVDPNIYLIKDVNWYFAAQFKSKNLKARNALVLSLYSHHRYNTMDTPGIIVYYDSAPKVFSWFESELEKIKKASTKI